MATCPNCTHELHLPWQMRVSGLAWQLRCPNCKRALRCGRPLTNALAVLAVVLLSQLIASGRAPLVGLVASAAVILLAASIDLLRPKLRLNRQ